MKVNMNSWHYRFIANMNERGQVQADNTCQYIRSFIFACFKAAFIVAAAIFGVSIVLGPFVVSILSFIFSDLFEKEFYQQAYLVSILVISAITICFAIWGISRGVARVKERMRERAYERLEDPEDADSFIAIARQWHKKICHKVDYI